MRLRPYPLYKPSLVDWLGNIPEHWGVLRGRYCFRVNPRSQRIRAASLEEEVSFVPMEAIGERGGLELDAALPIAEGGTYTEFEDGDVIVAKITPCFENGKGALATALLNGAAYGTTELHVLRVLPNLERRFLFYLTISDIYRKLGEAEMQGAAGQKRVPASFTKNLYIPVPPISEQRGIADWLDKATNKIDTLLAKKRRLIERLREKRSAVISRVVTRGLPPDAARAACLNPHPKLKPSGIDWIGEIPEHWNAVPLFRIVEEIQTGPFGSQLHQHDYVEGGIPLVNPVHIQEGGIEADEHDTVTPDTAARLGRYRLRRDDIVFARRGDIGRCAFVDDRASYRRILVTA